MSQNPQRLFLTIITGTFVVFVTCGDVWAQAAAQIGGTARDQSGAVLPGVTITATQTDTAVSRETVTNETGSYILPNLPIGPYRLEAALQGFATAVQTGIVLQVNATQTINLVLEVSQLAETVEVQGSTPLVETRSVGVGQVIENERILELPLNGRQVTELIATVGATTPSTAGVNSRNPFVTTVISVAGGSSMGLNYMLDGANHNNPFYNTYMSVPFPDALQEFKVETSATSAQNGTKAAGTVSLVTKSGTNALRGNLFEFVRNGAFNARNFFAAKKDNLRRNQYGGTAGGPIVSSKLFFFGAYQGTKSRQVSEPEVTFVPTAAALAGDLTVLASPECNRGRQISLRAPFVDNRIDPARLSKTAVALAAKLPGTTDPCGQTTTAEPDHTDQHMGVARIDYQKSSNHLLFGRYVVESVVSPTPYSLNQNLLSVGNGTDGLSQSSTFGSTLVLSDTVVNSLRVTGNRAANVRTGSDYYSWPEMGVKMFSYQKNRLAATVTGGFDVSHGGAGATTLDLFGINDDLSVIRGNHQLAFGAHFSGWRGNSNSDFYSYGRAVFDGSATNLAMADYLMGNVSEWTMGTPAPQIKKNKYVGLYGADTWKLRDNVTLNYGLRWEPWFPPTHLDGSAMHFDLDALRKGIKTTQFKNLPPGLFFDGDPGFPGKTAMDTQWLNFSPRVGLAWDVSGDGRTSIRTSFGTFYDYVHMFYHVGLSNAPPTSQRQIVQGVSLDDPWANWPGGDPFPMPHGAEVTPDVPWSPFSVVTALDYDTKNTRVHQWNLSLQRQIGIDWVVSATYLGSGTRHLWGTQQLNPAVYIPGVFNANRNCIFEGRILPFTGNPGTPCSTTRNTNQRRVLNLENPATGQFFGTVNRIESGGTASYNGLLLSVQRRATRGVTINGNYTWSHCISDPGGADVGNSGNANGGYLEPNDRRRDRGNCTGSATDRRHNFGLSASIATPDFSSRALHIVASGWRFSPILRIISGEWVTVTTRDIALTAISNQRVNQVLDDVYGDKTVNNYLNPLAFAQPATGTLGNLGAGSIEGPGSWTFDAALSRTLQLGNSDRVEFRAEAFNVTNAFRARTLVTNFNNSNFGRITRAQDPRIMQFALKYFF